MSEPNIIKFVEDFNNDVDIYNFLNDKTNNLKINDVTIIPGKVLQYLSAQSVAHLLMVIFIILGNISYYYSRRSSEKL